MPLKLALCLLYVYTTHVKTIAGFFSLKLTTYKFLNARDPSEIVKVQCSFNKLQ